jgi:hypothetical protein
LSQKNGITENTVFNYRTNDKINENNKLGAFLRGNKIFKFMRQNDKEQVQSKQNGVCTHTRKKNKINERLTAISREIPKLLVFHHKSK